MDDLFKALDEFDGLDTFCLLPEGDRKRFVGWIATARDDSSYWARINAIALAIRVGPLRADVRIERPEAV